MARAATPLVAWFEGDNSHGQFPDRAEPDLRLYPDRAAGGDRDHRGPDRAVAPGGAGAREAARRAQCVNNLKQIGIALQSYHDAHGILPIGWQLYQSWDTSCSYHPRCHSIFTAILPYVEQATVFNAVNFLFGAAGDVPHFGVTPGQVQATALQTRVTTFICPSETSEMTDRNKDYPGSQGSYAAVIGFQDTFRWWYGCPYAIPPDGVFGLSYSTRLSDISDGTSNTMFVGEASRFSNEVETWYNRWSTAGWAWSGTSIPGVTRIMSFATTAPRLNADLQIPDPNKTLNPTGWVDSWVYAPDPKANALNAGQFGFRSPHPGGALFLFGDGSVRFLKDTIDMGSSNYADRNVGVYRKLSTKAGGEVISADAY
jgi:prepilin-type processing-associated H-X9-DG protein